MTAEPSPRPVSTTEHILPLDSGPLPYRATAGWQRLAERDRPVADMFYVAYMAEVKAGRSLTFIFNGGPGAASAYLHMGALGPKRIQFGPQGRLPPSPVELVDNLESWLSFTDLVFVDPIGTGFSRSLPVDEPHAPGSGTDGATSRTSPQSTSGKPADPPKESQFWEVERDLNALGEFIQRFLSAHGRWLSPIFIAGESYGGFRAARLARSLQQDFGIGLSGTILISPALEFSLLAGSDYNLLPWATVLPSMAAAAAHHGQAAWVHGAGDYGGQMAAAEAFTYGQLMPTLALGKAGSAAARQAMFQGLADLTGLPYALVERHGGRLSASLLARELLRDRQQIVGLYDATLTAVDPFPDRDPYQGSDPTLDGIGRLFAGAINSHLRTALGVETDLIYELLNFETFKAWEFKLDHEFKQGYLGSMDDLRIGMTLNPHMGVYITHGWFDLVTPYFASNYLVEQLRLPENIRANLTLKHFAGGHMFYTWDSSRQEWFGEMRALYQS
ncbi:peptidase S10 [filamentous cyanobacterium CCP5]|nr:peptidase S10 [filamentous cyanobacterium CCP5]